MVNQACHACVQMAWDAREDPLFRAYVSAEEGQMTKVTLGAKDEGELRKVAKRLDERKLRYAMWTEMPENILAGLASWPNRRSVLQKAIKGLRRF